MENNKCREHKKKIQQYLPPETLKINTTQLR